MKTFVMFTLNYKKIIPKKASTYLLTKINLNVTQYQSSARFSWSGNCTAFSVGSANDKTNTVNKQYDQIISSPKHSTK
jgi:hypothetical protein